MKLYHGSTVIVDKPLVSYGLGNSLQCSCVENELIQ